MDLETEPRSLKFCSRAVGRRDSEVPIVLGPGVFPAGRARESPIHPPTPVQPFSPSAPSLLTTLCLDPWTQGRMSQLPPQFCVLEPTTSGSEAAVNE